MSTSRVPEALEQLPATIRASPALAALNADADIEQHVAVIDGDTAEDDTTDAIYTAYDADPESKGEVVTSRFAWAGVGNKARDEVIDIVGAVVATNGEGDVVAARARAYQLLAIVDEAVRADPSLGMGAPRPTRAELTEHRLIPLGDEMWIRFTVSVTTRSTV